MDFHNCLLDLFQEARVCFVWIFWLERNVFLILFTCKIQITFKSLSNGMIKVTGTDVCVVRGVIYSLLLITALELILFFTISLNLV